MKAPFSTQRAGRHKALVLIAAGIFSLAIAYWLAGVLIYERGRAEHRALNAQAAERKYAFIRRYYPPILGLTQSVAKNDTICRAYLAAHLAYELGIYETATTQYAQFLDDYPADPLVQLARAEYPAAWLAWIIADQQAGLYMQAIQQSQILIAAYPDSSQAAQAQNILPLLYIAIGQAHQASDEYAQAIEMYIAADETTSGTNPAVQARRHIQSAHLDWGDDLLEQRHYRDALDHYQAALEFSADETADVTISQRIVDAYLAWGHSIRSLDAYGVAIELIKSTGISRPEFDAFVQDTYRQWADGEIKEHRYAAAIAVYRKQLLDTPTDQVGPVHDAAIATYLRWGQWAQELPDYQQTLAVYIELGQVYPEYPAVQDALTQLPRLHFDWAQYAHQQSDFETAVVQYELCVTRTLDVELARQATTGAAQALYDWGQHLSRQGQHEQAIALYQRILDDYAWTPITGSVYTATAAAYHDWGNNLRQTGEYEQAILKYESAQLAYRLAETAGVISAAEAQAMFEIERKNIAYVYIDWGNRLNKEGLYLDAAKKFEWVLANGPDETNATNASRGYQIALQGMAQLEGQTGQQLVADATRLICQGRTPVYPIYGLSTGQERKIALAGDLVQLPAGLQATCPAHLYYAGCLIEGVIEMQRCTYSNDHTLVRQQLWWKIVVRDIQTGDPIAEQTFYGGLPPHCPEHHYFYEPIAYLSGTPPGNEPIVNWLKSILK